MSPIPLSAKVISFFSVLALSITWVADLLSFTKVFFMDATEAQVALVDKCYSYINFNYSFIMVKVNIIIQKVNKPENQDLLKDDAVAVDGNAHALLSNNVSVRLKV